jgi:acetyl-CoA decarbonylase/synthase, CODH/ACS complex subunit gamma
MPLSGIQIFKLLPQTNCKECGFPTCLAFAMKLAAKQAELSACPYVSEASKTQLAESAAPPMRLISIKSKDVEIKVGNETVLFRHDKTFYNQPGIFLRIDDTLSVEEIKNRVAQAEAYRVSYVGMELALDGYAVTSISGNPTTFASIVQVIRQASKRPLLLVSRQVDVISAGLKVLNGESPLICGADSSNWEAMADLAKQNHAALVVSGQSLDLLADLTQKIKAKGVEDMVLDSEAHTYGKWVSTSTQLRRLALKKNFRPLGYPLLGYGKAFNPAQEVLFASQLITKYAGIIILDHFSPAALYPLLVLRQNIYTDPQKPIQVLPGLYPIGDPTPAAPVLVTTNFSITYFSVANEIENAGKPAWLLVTDSEGMSVLTAWAAGKFDAAKIAKNFKEFGVADKVNSKRIVLPGHVAVISGELEEQLPGWEIRVGPREAVDIPAYFKQTL